MANRKITEEQFTDGSTIDGTRINKAFTDTFSKLNNLPIGEVEQCFVPRTIHFGWQAGHYSQNFAIDDTCSPTNFFFSLYNSFARDVTGVTKGRLDVNNKWRYKGTRINNGGIVATPAASTTLPSYNSTDVCGRTWSYYFDKPAIITDITVMWEYDNWTGLYEEPLVPNDPPTFIERARVEQLWLGELFIDSPFVPEDKRKGTVAWRRTEKIDPVRFSRQDFRGYAMVPRNTGTNDFFYGRQNRVPSNDFRPNAYQNGAPFPVGTAQSNHPVYDFWWDKNLNISVPGSSRIHFGLGAAVNADFGSVYPTFGVKEENKAFQGLRYNVSISLLEVVE